MCAHAIWCRRPLQRLGMDGADDRVAVELVEPGQLRASTAPSLHALRDTGKGLPVALQRTGQHHVELLPCSRKCSPDERSDAGPVRSGCRSPQRRMTPDRAVQDTDCPC